MIGRNAAGGLDRQPFRPHSAYGASHCMRTDRGPRSTTP